MSMQRVAQLAGVSTSTVSRVVNEHPSVAPQTAESVRRAMDQLRFTASPRRARRRPRHAPAHAATIAFLIFGTSGSNAAPAFESLLRGVSEGASAHDLGLTFGFVADRAKLPQRIADR